MLGTFTSPGSCFSQVHGMKEFSVATIASNGAPGGAAGALKVKRKPARQIDQSIALSSEATTAEGTVRGRPFLASKEPRTSDRLLSTFLPFHCESTTPVGTPRSLSDIAPKWVDKIFHRWFSVGRDAL